MTTTRSPATKPKKIPSAMFVTPMVRGGSLSYEVDTDIDRVSLYGARSRRLGDYPLNALRKLLGSGRDGELASSDERHTLQVKVYERTVELQFALNGAKVPVRCIFAPHSIQDIYRKLPAGDRPGDQVKTKVTITISSDTQLSDADLRAAVETLHAELPETTVQANRDGRQIYDES